MPSLLADAIGHIKSGDPPDEATLRLLDGVEDADVASVKVLALVLTDSVLSGAVLVQATDSSWRASNAIILARLLRRVHATEPASRAAMTL